MPTAWPSATRRCWPGIVSDMYCSSWGDDALLALGDIALERGEAERRPQLLGTNPRAAARVGSQGRVRGGHRRRQRPTRSDPRPIAARSRGRHQWYAGRRIDRAAPATACGTTSPVGRRGPAFDPILEGRPAADHPSGLSGHHAQSGRRPARLVLASIFEGSLARAEGELEAFERLHPDGRRKSGRPARALCQGARAAAGRSRKLAQPSGPAKTGRRLPATRPATKLPARRSTSGAALAGDSAGRAAGGRRHECRSGSAPIASAERSDGLLSYHPVVVGEMILVSTGRQIFAFNLHTGKPLWPGNPQQPAGEIYRDEGHPTARSTGPRGIGRAAVHDDRRRRPALRPRRLASDHPADRVERIGRPAG